MREVEKILAAFPGPVVLHAGALKKLLTLVICLAFTVGCVLAVLSGRTRILHGVYDTIMGPIAVLGFAILTIRSLIVLLAPSAASLTLDADGFAINSIFRTQRKTWREVSGFRVQKTPMGFAAVTYDLLGADAARPRLGMIMDLFTLMDSYGQSKDDLAWLMSEWRQRALAQQP